MLSAMRVGQDAGERLLDGQMHHFGDDSTPEWPEAPSEPEPAGLVLRFESRANRGEWTLAFYQRHINNTWQIKINGQVIGLCARTEPLIESFFAVPAGTLVDGPNRFELTTDSDTDDVTFGRIRLIETPFRETLRLVPVRLTIRDSSTLNPIPGRISITDSAGAQPAIYFADSLQQARRAGVVYSATGNLDFEIREGDYELVASRGSEWSIATAQLSLRRPLEGDLDAGLRVPDAGFALTREVDTRGYVACDTHIHTLTFSGHGDASVEERLVTLAGEGVELAIATDHNHNTDYAPYQQRMGLGQHFTTVVGNEVTTPIGHFNAFPLDPAAEVPAYELEDVVQLVDSMRERGALAVILNHPRWPSHEDSPFGNMQLEHFTGSGDGSHFATYPFDAMELVNSCTAESDPQLLFEDWFALLNRGERIAAVGSSDSHTVSRPVGGGRTYVPWRGEDLSAIDSAAAAAAIAQGRTSICMGIYLETSVVSGGTPQRVGMGELAHVAAEGGRSELRVQAPSWIRPREARLYANGSLLEQFELETEAGQKTDLRLVHELSERHAGQDAWLVWVVTGDGVQGNFWPLHNDYTLGATNPVFLDWSGDGAYQSPRETALALLAQHGARSCVRASSWEAVNFHALELSRLHLLGELQNGLERLGSAAELDPDKLAEYLRQVERK